MKRIFKLCAFLLVFALGAAYLPRMGAVQAAGAGYRASGSWTEGKYTVKIYLEGMNAAGGSFGMRYDPAVLGEMEFTPYVSLFNPPACPVQDDRTEGYHTFTYVADDGGDGALNRPDGIDGTRGGGTLIASYAFPLSKEDYEAKLTGESIGPMDWTQTPNGQDGRLVESLQTELYRPGDPGNYVGYPMDGGPAQELPFIFADKGIVLPQAQYVLEGAAEENRYTLKVSLRGINAAGGCFGMSYDRSKLTLSGFEAKVIELSPGDFPTQNNMSQGYHTFFYLADDGGGGPLCRPSGLDGSVAEGCLLGVYTFEILGGAQITEEDFSAKNFFDTPNGSARMAEEVWRPDAAARAGGYYQAYFMEEGDGKTDVKFGFEEKQGVTVRGQFRSWDPKKEATVSLLQAGVTKYSTAVGAGEGTGRQVQEFVLQDVAPGTYTLVITKPSHLSFTKQTVTVGNTDVIVTGMTTGAEGDVTEVANLICGDINGDGAVKLADRSLLLRSQYYGKAVAGFQGTQREVAQLCDLDGDGYVKLNDCNIMMASENYNRDAVVIE